MAPGAVSYLITRGPIVAPQPSTLLLYSTEHCHLCEEALAIVLGQAELAGWALEVADVALEPELFERYGERIPVLALGDRELNWPFDGADVLALCGFDRTP